ncbi:PEP-CTERM sorting domain-containing protein [Chamaesiphon sp. VAR_48_metabat_403]|uniref:PEP-CTERM sorting domain-containing protein n=1 Tax=Chamaesiphon sp. VAR_48_metabat_403 TaxID=2964700 RepID=UPI00286EA20F|nr:PEP-CTERM sorting domain-containing protein [Chamaesiphon sp. VAR_48_metabat_403]
MKNISLAIAGAACVALGGVSSVQAATLIDTGGNGGNGGTFSPFGETFNSSFGQTFTVGSDNILNDFTFWLNDRTNPDAVDFAAYVMAWDGTKATGSIIYQSSPQSTNGASGFEQFTFNTGGTNLTSGQQYVAFLSTFGLLDGITGQAQMGASFTRTYSGGEAVYTSTNFDPSSPNNSWIKPEAFGLGTFDAAFTANLSSASAQPVPEPSSSLGLLVFGGFVAGKVLKRKKAQLKIESQDKE